MTQEPIEYLDLDDLVTLATALLGDPPPIRDIGLLGSAVARPQTTAFGTDAYPGMWTKAAALLQSIVKNHALIDGNKRLGWLATAVFLELDDRSVAEADNDAVYELVIDVASKNRSVEHSRGCSPGPHPLRPLTEARKPCSELGSEGSGFESLRAR